MIKSPVDRDEFVALTPHLTKPCGLEILLKENLLNIALAVAILVGSYVIMHLFARAMYVRCFGCGTLNARRRVVCRQCGDRLQK